jgi:predicted small secreted protein
MNWKTFVSGVAIGAAAGYYVNKTIKKSSYISAEAVLGGVKKAFKEEGSIDGSWIQMTMEEYEKTPIKAKVYRGGITWRKDSERLQYEFIADAHTGTVIDVYPVG